MGSLYFRQRRKRKLDGYDTGTARGPLAGNLPSPAFVNRLIRRRRKNKSAKESRRRNR